MLDREKPSAAPVNRSPAVTTQPLGASGASSGSSGCGCLGSNRRCLLGTGSGLGGANAACVAGCSSPSSFP